MAIDKDELIAKLIIKFGIVEFMKVFQIINMNSDICYLCNRSIYMRIHDEWEKVIEDTTSS